MRAMDAARSPMVGFTAGTPGHRVRRGSASVSSLGLSVRFVRLGPWGAHNGLLSWRQLTVPLLHLEPMPSGRRRKFDDAVLYTAIGDVAFIAEVDEVSQSVYKRHRPPASPGVSVLIRHFGTWTEACRANGVGTGPYAPWRRESDEDWNRILREAAADLGEPLSVMRFRRWREDRTDVPQLPRGVSFLELCEAAGVKGVARLRPVQWSDKDLAKAIRRADRDGAMTAWQYRKWRDGERRAGRVRPSMMLIASRASVVNDWAAARRDAGLEGSVTH